MPYQVSFIIYWCSPPTWADAKNQISSVHIRKSIHNINRLDWVFRQFSQELHSWMLSSWANKFKSTDSEYPFYLLLFHFIISLDTNIHLFVYVHHCDDAGSPLLFSSFLLTSPIWINTKKSNNHNKSQINNHLLIRVCRLPECKTFSN